VNLDLESVLLNILPKLFRRLFQLLARSNVVEQCWTQELDVLCGQPSESQVNIEFSSNDNNIKRVETYASANPVTGPDALPKLTILPFLLTTDKQLSNVTLPTESNTTCTPSPPVISSTFFTNTSLSSS
jgi:hypothetical protein